MPRMLSFGPVRVRTLPIRGASAVAAIPGGLLVVDDDKGILRVAGGRAEVRVMLRPEHAAIPNPMQQRRASHFMADRIPDRCAVLAT